MIEIFTTNVQDKVQADKALKILQSNFPELKINFDLDSTDTNTPNCHNILRVEGNAININKVMSIVIQNGFSCDILEDKVCK